MARIFDWLDCVERNGIDYIDRGPNVSRGEINVKCPFCGSADPSYHLGLSLTSGYWACWRNADHRGKSPIRLLVRLLRVPYWKARQLAGLDDDYIDPEGFSAAAARLLRSTADVVAADTKKLVLPDSFDLVAGSGNSRWHFQYLEQARGFGEYTADVVEEYLLCFDKAGGSYQDRVILPYIEENELVAWTGRAISSRTPIRYRDLETEDCVVPIKETLYNHDVVISGGEVLTVLEGPIDALKLDFFGKEHKVRAAALSTNNMSEQQMYILEEASVNFDKVVFMMDQKKSGLGIVDSMRIRQRIRTIKNARIVPVPFGRKDAGEFTPLEAVECAKALRSMK